MRTGDGAWEVEIHTGHDGEHAYRVRSLRVPAADSAPAVERVVGTLAEVRGLVGDGFDTMIGAPTSTAAEGPARGETDTR